MHTIANCVHWLGSVAAQLHKFHACPVACRQLSCYVFIIMTNHRSLFAIKTSWAMYLQLVWKRSDSYKKWGKSSPLIGVMFSQSQDDGSCTFNHIWSICVHRSPFNTVSAHWITVSVSVRYTAWMAACKTVKRIWPYLAWLPSLNQHMHASCIKQVLFVICWQHDEEDLTLMFWLYLFWISTCCIKQVFFVICWQ